MKRPGRLRGVLAIGLGAAVALSACGSSSSGPPTASSGGAAGGTAAPAVTAKIMLAANITSSTVPFTTPEVVSTVKGAFRDLPGVRVEVCDTKGTPAAGLTCQQKAVQEKVAGVIDASSYLSQNSELLARAGIPTVGTPDATKPNSFVLISPLAEFIGIGFGLAKTGCRKLGTIYLDGSGPLADAIRQGVVAGGGQEIARAAIPAQAPDVSPAVARLTGAGADCVAVSVAPTTAVQVLTALKQTGRKVTVGSTSAVFPDRVITSLGPLADGLYVTDQTRIWQDPGPGIEEIKSDIRAENSKDPVTQVGIVAWVAAKYISAALRTMHGEATAPTLTTALNGLRNVSFNGVVPPLSSVELTNPLYTRLFNPYGIVYRVDGGKFTPQGDFFDLKPALQAR